MIPDLCRSCFAFQFLPPMPVAQNDPAGLRRQTEIKEESRNDGATAFGNVPVVGIVTQDST
jgi:hypothetical protein